jgi:hypothetical protein
MYVLKWNLTLHIVIVCTPFIFVDDSIIFVANYRRFCTSKTEYLYLPLSIHILLALIFMYFSLDHFIMFQNFNLEYTSCTFTWNVHFQNWTFVLSRFSLYTSHESCIYILPKFIIFSTSGESCTSDAPTMYFPK